MSSFEELSCGSGSSWASLMELVCDVVECLPQATCVFEADGRLLAMNRKQEILLGMPKENCLGASAFESVILRQRGFDGLIRSVQLGESEKGTRRDLSGALPCLQAHDGYLFELRPILDVDELLGVLVTTFQREEATDRRSVEHQDEWGSHSLFTNFPDALMVVGADLTIKKVNTSMVRLLGSETESQVIDTRCHAILCEESTPCSDCPALAAMHTGRTSKARVLAKSMTHAGTVFEVGAVPLPSTDKNAQTALVCVREMAHYQAETTGPSQHGHEASPSISEGEEELGQLVIRHSDVTTILLDERLTVQKVEGETAARYGAAPHVYLFSALPELRTPQIRSGLEAALIEDKISKVDLTLPGRRLILSCSIIPWKMETHRPGAVLLLRPLAAGGKGRRPGALTKLSVLSDLTSSVVHDINNSLTNISSRIEVLQLKDIGSIHRDRWESEISLIREQANRIGSITQRLMAIQKNSMVDFETVDINEALENALSESLVSSDHSRVLVSKHLDGGQFTVYGHERSIQQCLTNIIDNAFEAMGGEGTLTVTSTGRHDSGIARIAVEDSGVGIPPAIVDRIFEPFFTTNKYRRALGLGLSVAYSIVIDHGGEMRVTSKIGKGTRVCIDLPVAVRASCSRPHGSQEGQLFVGSEGRGEQCS